MRYLLIFALGAGLVSVSAQLPAKTEGVDQARQLVAEMTMLSAVTEKDMKNFDAELDDPDFDLFSSESYQRLLAARSIYENLEEQVAQRYEDPSFQNEVASVVKNSTGQDLPKETEEALPVLSKVVNTEWTQLASNPVLQNQGMDRLLPRYKVQLASVSQEMKQSLVHYVGGSFQNINGTGFRKGSWALTFDDGPHATRSKTVLSNLQKYGYSATFFELAQLVKRLPSVTRMLLGAGMEIGNHSYDHANLAKSSAAGLEKEINSSSDIIESVTGRRLQYFRLPYGSGQSSSRIRSMLAQRGLIHVAWNVDTLDWRDHNPQSIYNRAVKQMRAHGGGVILFHDIHAQSVAASALLMQAMHSGQITGNLTTVSQAR
jgi:peptidoglycan/xylan/chitin deacetylase (PgdA/CDA1 family)